MPATAPMLRLPQFGRDSLADQNAALNNAEPEAIVKWAVKTFGRDLALTCSFGGVSGMVLVDLVLKEDPSIPVLVLDTGFLFDETYKLIDEVEAMYGIAVRRIKPQLTPDEQAAIYGPNLYQRDPTACCQMRKVDPLAEALKPYQAWITGIRRDQGPTRADTPVVAWTAKHDLYKIAPLANWTEESVWAHVHSQGLPFNPLLASGYTSIGCETCTAKPTSSDPRSGRWAGFGKTECGLHL